MSPPEKSNEAAVGLSKNVDSWDVKIADGSEGRTNGVKNSNKRYTNLERSCHTFFEKLHRV